jgi:hypothetical protein
MEDPVAPIAVLQGDRTPGLQLGGFLPLRIHRKSDNGNHLQAKIYIFPMSIPRKSVIEPKRGFTAKEPVCLNGLSSHA